MFTSFGRSSHAPRQKPNPKAPIQKLQSKRPSSYAPLGYMPRGGATVCLSVCPLHAHGTRGNGQSIHAQASIAMELRLPFHANGTRGQRQSKLCTSLYCYGAMCPPSLNMT